MHHPANRSHADIGRAALSQEQFFEPMNFLQGAGTDELVVADCYID